MPRAVVGRGPAARRLAERVLAGPGAWTGVVGAELLVVMGPDLPWVDGALYLGSAAAAPRVLHDCRVEPDVPADLLARAVHRRVPGLVALLTAPDLLVPLGAAEPFHPPALRRWLA